MATPLLLLVSVFMGFCYCVSTSPVTIACYSLYIPSFFFNKKKIINFLFVSFFFFFSCYQVVFLYVSNLCFSFFSCYKSIYICDLYNDDDEWMMIWLY
jgi:hypothetical protein